MNKRHFAAILITGTLIALFVTFQNFDSAPTDIPLTDSNETVKIDIERSNLEISYHTDKSNLSEEELSKRLQEYEEVARLVKAITIQNVKLKGLLERLQEQESCKQKRSLASYDLIEVKFEEQKERLSTLKNYFAEDEESATYTKAANEHQTIYSAYLQEQSRCNTK